MQMEEETHIKSEFKATLSQNSRTERKNAHKINQEVSELSTHRDFDSVDYSFDGSGSYASIEVTLVSESQYKRDAHREAVEVMCQEVMDARFDDYEVRQNVKEVEVEVEEEDEE